MDPTSFYETKSTGTEIYKIVKRVVRPEDGGGVKPYPPKFT